MQEKMMMRINLTKMVLAQIIPTQKTTDLTMRKIRIQKMRMMPLKTLRTRTRKKILLIMKIQKILVPIMRTREKTAVHLIQLLPFLSIPEFS